jgi:hypothetical protein
MKAAMLRSAGERMEIQDLTVADPETMLVDLYLAGRLELYELLTETIEAINESYAELAAGRKGRGVIVF